MFTAPRAASSLIAALLFVGAAAQAAESPELHLGVVVSASAETLVIVDQGGSGHETFQVPPGAAVTLNGVPAKLDDLTLGDLVTVTTETVDGRPVVTNVDAKSAVIKRASR